MKRQKDTKYFLIGFSDNKIMEQEEYKQIKRIIDEFGYLKISLRGYKAKVYSVELALFFMLHEVSARNTSTKEMVNIKGIDYLPDFLKGYKEGKEYLNVKDFEINNKDLIEQIYDNYYNVLHKNTIQGWNYVRRFSPLMITHKEIKEFGYYSGILSKADDLIKKSPALRKYFESKKEETDNKPQPHAQDNLTRIKILERFDSMSKVGYKYAFRTKDDFNRFVNILTNFFEYKQYSLPDKQIKLKRGCKTKLAIALGEIHAELSNVDVFKNDKEYFKIVKCLSPYSGLTDYDLYKAMTRFRH